MQTVLNCKLYYHQELSIFWKKTKKQNHSSINRRLKANTQKQRRRVVNIFLMIVINILCNPDSSRYGCYFQ